MLGQAESLELKPNEADEYVKDIAFTLLGAGTDTTATTLLIFILAMVLFPDTQRKAQSEIDAVLGAGRLPTMKDRPQLDYVNRLIEEVLRWRPAAPIGVPHSCIQDDVYQGYCIPKGSVV
ncbi:hypothetical protein FRC09_000776 [Ceratobasidium sp. 395]|nr:hypothetical protein FRC09_000776 [Ceratobasidium sp. 395]